MISPEERAVLRITKWLDKEPITPYFPRDYWVEQIARQERCNLSDCNFPLRGASNCKLDPNHKGRHSSVAFTCDSCNKKRRGTPISNDYGTFCFMCQRGLI